MLFRRARVRPILRYGDPRLHAACAPVESFDRDLAGLVEDLFATMRAAEGVGLAANQVGVGLRVFVYDCPDADGTRHRGHLVNPVLDAASLAGKSMAEEGCLSVPGPHVKLARAATATATGQTVRGETITVSGTGYLARCLQHEIDHLDGVVYVDHLTPRHRLKVLAESGLT